MVLTIEDLINGEERHTAEEIVSKLRQVGVLIAKARRVFDAVRSLGVTEATYYRWQNEYSGLKVVK
jgi:putative transposase